MAIKNLISGVPNEDQISTPTPPPPVWEFLTKDFRLQPGLE